MRPSRFRARILAAAWLVAGLLAGVPSAVAASRYDPALRFRVIATPHFFIYFHQGEEAIARRFVPMAEDIHADLTRRLRASPSGRTHVILVDQNDTSNGWATALPYNTIELTVTPPAERTYVTTDDWLRLVFAHEYTHVLQFDRSSGYASVARHVFGRSPISFPNLFLPAWQIEGLATYEESATTGRGRVHAGDFAVLVDQAAPGGALSLDRASSHPDDWPDGQTPYAWGAFFYQYLAQRFGDDTLAELSARTAGRFYFLSSPAFKQVFGRSLGDLWRDFERSRAERAQAGAPDTGRRLTTHGFRVAGPRFVQLPGEPLAVVYSAGTAHDFPALLRVDLDGRVRRLASRYSGEQLGVSGTAAVFDEIDLSHSVAQRSDLSVVDLSSGAVTRLTSGARLVDSAVSPAGSALACVRLQGGERHLAVFDLPPGVWPRDVARLRAVLAGEPRIEIADPGVEYSSPRWSADGHAIAASRHVRGGPSQIVVVEASSGAVAVVVSSDRARNVTPVWAPDGRTIVFASDRRPGLPDEADRAGAQATRGSAESEPFNLFAVEVPPAHDGPSPVFQLTDFATGATYPDISPDGRQLAYVGYTVAGYDVFVAPFDRSTWRPVPDERRSDERPTLRLASLAQGGRLTTPDQRPTTPDQRPTTPDQRPTTPDQRPTTNNQQPTTTYTPWRTLLPRYWMPAFDVSDQQLKLGAQTSGSDVLARHLYSATVLFRVAGEAGAPGSRRYDWAAAYTYDRWVPSFFAAVADRTHFLRDVVLRSGAIVPADERSQNEEIGVFVPDVHVRRTQSLAASLNFERRTVNAGGLAGGQSDRNALRLAWMFSSAMVYPYSISPEQGATIGVTGELVRHALGADADAAAGTVDGRVYLRLGGRHTILALRAAAGIASGDPRTERIFYLGGDGPNANPAAFGSDSLNLLRGFGLNEFAGTRVAVANLEYRVPLVRVQRGAGTWPVFVRALHAAGFLDFGKTWVSSFSGVPVARSAGGEVAADLRLAYGLDLTVAAGVAWPHDPGGATRPAVAYMRLGHAF